MISKLTKEQEMLIPKYIEESLSIGLSTKPLNRDNAFNCAKDIIRFLEPSLVDQLTIKVLPSPKACQLEWNKLQGNKDFIFDSQYYSPLYWQGYYTMYKYIRNELFPEKIEEYPFLDRVLDWSKEIHYMQISGTTVLLSERPTILIKNERGLHNETGMALQYSDGWGLYQINGVNMNSCKWFFDTSMSNEDKAVKIMTVPNVEQRSELIRSFGMAKIYHTLDHKTIDTRADGYELLSLNLGNNVTGIYLKMINPSTSEIHIEGVSKGCQTIEDALKNRVPQRLVQKYGYNEAIARS